MLLGRPVPRAIVSASVLAALVGCSSPEAVEGRVGATCKLAFVGSDAGSPELVPGVAVDGGFVELGEGGALPLATPPQGGHVSFVAARATNLDPCGVKLKATVRSPRTGFIAAEEERTVTLSVADGGWAEAELDDISNFANVPMCPDYPPNETLVDLPYDLEVRVVDRAGRTAHATRSIVPRCEQTEPYDRALCRCECSEGYALGRCADPLDGGWLEVVDGGSPDAAAD